MIINKDDKCKRCGKCCYTKTKKGWKPCRYLEFLKDGTTRCKIYWRRLGTLLGRGHECMLRKYVRWDYPDCPYNTDKPIHPYWRKNNGT